MGKQKLKYKISPLHYLYFSVIVLFVITVFSRTETENKKNYNYDTYEYILLDNYDSTIAESIEDKNYSWKTSKVGKTIPNPNKSKYVLAKFKIPDDVNGIASLYITTEKNNFNIFYDGQFKETPSKIQLSKYIKTPMKYTYSKNDIKKEENIYLYMQTNVPKYAGYINNISITYDESPSAVLSKELFNYLLFVICMVYLIIVLVYTIYYERNIRPNQFRYMFFASFSLILILLSHSSVILTLFNVITWTSINTLSRCAFTWSYLNVIRVYSKDENVKRYLKYAGNLSILLSLLIIYLNLSGIAFYSITNIIIEMYLIIILPFISYLIYKQTKNKPQAILLTTLNCIFNFLTLLHILEETKIITFYSPSLLLFFIMCFILINIYIFKMYMEKNLAIKNMIKEVNSKAKDLDNIIVSLDNTLKTGNDMDATFVEIHKSISMLINDLDTVYMYIYYIDNQKDIFKNVYKQGSMTHYKQEVKNDVDNIKKLNKDIIKSNNNSTIFYLVENNFIQVAFYLENSTYFKKDEIELIYLFFNSIKKNIQNTLVYRDSILNQQSVLFEVAKIINKREEYKYNSKAIGELCYYISKKIGMNYTEAVYCKIVSYAINIGKLNINSNNLSKKYNTLSEREESKQFINISYEMLKNYDNVVMKIGTKVAQQFYENYNGSGSFGLKGKDIDIYARIIRVAYDFVYYYLSDLPNSSGDYSMSLQILKVYENIKYDPVIINCLVENQEEIKQILDKNNKRDVS